jgi:hypothetical protein
MEARMVCTKSKLGHSLSQISELTGLSIDEVKGIIGRATGLTPTCVGIIMHMKQRGLSLAHIYQETGVELQVLELFLPQEAPAIIKEPVVGFEAQLKALAGKGPYEISRRLGISEGAVLAYMLGSPDDGVLLTRKASKPPTEEAKQPQRPQPTQHTPTFFYSCQRDTNQLHRVNFLTGEQSEHRVPDYQFKVCCRWSELPGGSLLITGGGIPAVRDAVRLDVGTFAVSPQPPMHTAKADHAAVYHSQYVYVLGGEDDYEVYLKKCERYSCAESRWEVLAALPVACRSMSAVELHNSLYALGGYGNRGFIDSVQKFDLDSLTWQLMQLKLPQPGASSLFFKTDTEVYLVIMKTLYSFTPLEIKQIKILPENIGGHSSYYRKGTLYYEGGSGIKLTSLL